MTEKLVKVLEEEKDRIVASATESIDHNRDDAIRRIETRFKELEDVLQLALPKSHADMIELMWRGGVFKTVQADVPEDNTPLTLEVGNTTLIDRYTWNSQWLKKGKHRITLIIEPLEASV